MLVEEEEVFSEFLTIFESNETRRAVVAEIMREPRTSPAGESPADGSDGLDESRFADDFGARKVRYALRQLADKYGDVQGLDPEILEGIVRRRLAEEGATASVADSSASKAKDDKRLAKN